MLDGHDSHHFFLHHLYLMSKVLNISFRLITQVVENSLHEIVRDEVFRLIISQDLLRHFSLFLLVSTLGIILCSFLYFVYDVQVLHLLFWA